MNQYKTSIWAAFKPLSTAVMVYAALALLFMAGFVSAARFNTVNHMNEPQVSSSSNFISAPVLGVCLPNISTIYSSVSIAIILSSSLLYSFRFWCAFRCFN